MIELVLRAPAPLVDPVSDLLMDELGALSVSVEDADADTDAEQALFGEPGMPAPAAGWERSTLKALFDDDTAAERAATLVLAQDWAAGVHVQALQPMPEQDWVRLTQSQFAPVEITPTFWVVPSWHQPPAAARQVIRLDPGLAFGTGTHPTTRMCLRWLATHGAAVAGQRTLDYGCGSGILAIGAALFGAAPIDAVDIDAAAVQSTRDNAAHNGVAPALLRPGLPEQAAGVYGLVLANILAMPLQLLAPLLSAHVAGAGWLVLAGILERQADELITAYAPWLQLAVSDREDGWILMTAQRPAAAAGATLTANRTPMATGLATRCPACDTVFRVVPDQLRVSEGWVRCGRCGEVFNATESFVDLDHGTLRPAPAPAAQAVDDGFDAQHEDVIDGGHDDHHHGSQYGSHHGGPHDGEPLDDGGPALAHGQRRDIALDAGHDPAPFDAVPAQEDRWQRAVPPAAAPTPAASSTPLPAAPAAAAPISALAVAAAVADTTPSFVRRAERARRWRQPRVRAALAAGSVLAALALAAQVAYAYRDLVAARLPATRGALEQACGWVGCTVGAAHVIDALVVESSGLVRVERSAIYRLSVALRNRAAIDVALPALELALTDAQGKLLARRVLQPAELGATQATLAAGRDLTLQATLQAAVGGGPAPVAGYTIELFYP